MDLIKNMKEQNIKYNAIITDPPYNISTNNNFKTMGRAGIDFGEWDKEFNLTSWIEPSIKQLEDGGNIIIFNDWKNMSYIKDELIKCGCLIKEMIIWHKTNPMPRNRDRLYVTSCEFAIWATKGKGWTFNRQRETYENTIFEYPIVSSKKRHHKTQKPIELMEDIIKIHTNEDDIVFDPFGGSFTIAVACKKLGRQFISCDLEEEFVEIGKKRLAEIIE
jgi:DNA modification methylase